MDYKIRPLNAWTDPETEYRKSSNVFRASWKDTLILLGSEIDAIGGVSPVVFQIDVQEGDLRLDGMLRANARAGHPGVVVLFDSKYGPLRYATDAYEQTWSRGLVSWQANIRAIALSLEKLRAVDRYGVTRRGEQYAGWKAITAGSGETFPSADEAWRWMLEKAHEPRVAMSTVDAQRVYRDLARKMHPDVGGENLDWDRLNSAKLLLRQAGAL